VAEKIKKENKNLKEELAVRTEFGVLREGQLQQQQQHVQQLQQQLRQQQQIQQLQKQLQEVQPSLQLISELNEAKELVEKYQLINEIRNNAVKEHVDKKNKELCEVTTDLSVKNFQLNQENKSLKMQVERLKENNCELEREKREWSGWACDLELSLEKLGYELYGPSKSGIVNCKKLP